VTVREKRKTVFVRILCVLVTLVTSSVAFGQAIPQKNVNVIGPTPVRWLYAGNPRMQQNEPECAVSPNNPEWLACGFNDYRGVNDPAIGDAFPGMSMSRDLGKSWFSGLGPGNLGETPNIGQKFGADANLEALPNLLLYNFIAGWRDDSQPGGVYVSRWYEHNRDVGPPWEALDIIEVDLGTSGKFLDKPAFDLTLRDPSLGLPDIEIAIPAYSDPRNLDNSHDKYTLRVPAARAHICYAVFVGNENNNGTKINCLASDDGGATWPIKSKLTESVEINQGISLASKNYGQEVMAVWRRFSDNNETSAIMFAKSVDAGSSWTKAEVLTEFCAFDQGTGAARFRTNALPVVVSSGGEFAVYFASRNDATTTCITPGKGKKPATQNMSPVADIDDFDSFGEDPPIDGVRQRDGQVRSRLNYSRIMMVRGSGDGARSWSSPVAIDPQEYPGGAKNGDGTNILSGSRIRGHQFMPAAEAAGGIETVAWYDSRLDKLNQRANPLPGGFVEDLVVHLEPPPAGSSNPNAWQSASLLPAGIYDLTPPPPNLPNPGNNIPLRRTLDVFAAQIDGSTGLPRSYYLDNNYYPAAGGSESPSTRVTRFATRALPGGEAGEREQVEWNYPNGRLFRKGKAPFIGDYNSVFAAQFRQTISGTWIPNQTAPGENDLFGSLEPMFHVGWTSNRNVRGRVFYTGCDVWNESLQMWETSAGCDSVYTDPAALMIPLQGEDGGADGPPLVCTPGADNSNFPLTRNQNIYSAAMKPGITVNVLTAIKRAQGTVNTFVLGIENGSPSERSLILELPAGSLTSFTNDVDGDGAVVPDLSIPVNVPRGMSNVRTVFDFGNDADPSLPDSVVLTVRDAGTTQILAKVALLRSSLAPLENVQNKSPCDPLAPAEDPNFCTDPIDLLEEGEYYDLILKRELTALDLENLDLENLDLENTVQLLDLENLDLENLAKLLDLENLDLENLDLENLDLENLDLENVLLFLDLENLDLENLDLENSLYANLDLENGSLYALDLENLDLENSFLQFLDLENLDLENLDLENLDLENLDLENLDLENLDLENLDLENFSIFALDLENLDLENLDLENAAPGDQYTEISWTADSATTTTTGVDVKPIFSPNLVTALAASPGSRVLLTVRQPYMTSTVVNNEASARYCAPQVVVENQLLYAAILDADQINSSIADPDPNNPDAASFVIGPDQSTIITLRFINPPANIDLDRNTGMTIHAQPGSVPSCEIEIGGGELEPACEIDYVEPDSTPPVIAAPADVGPIEATGPLTPVASAVLGTASATDNVSSPAEIVITNTAPGSFPVGTTPVEWTATDAEGNQASSTQQVTIVDTTPPAITLLPGIVASGIETTEAGFAFSDPGATAIDLVDGTVLASCVENCVPDTSTHGAPFIVKYTAADSATPPNSAFKTRSVTVVDSIPPTIALNGAASVIVEAGSSFNDLATAADAGSPGLTLQRSYFVETVQPDGSAIEAPVGNVDTSVVGTYFVYYNATDAAGLSATPVKRTVIVEDSEPPVIVIDNPPVFDPTLLGAVVYPDETFDTTWDVGGQDLQNDLTITCSIYGNDPNVSYPIVIEPESALYDAVTGTLNAVFNFGFPAGESTGTCTVTDQGGNSVTSDPPFSIFIEDFPVIDTDSLPSPLPLPIEANDPIGYVGPTASLWDPVVATDIVDAVSINAVCSPEVEDQLLFGLNTITCVATDSAGNESDPVTFEVLIEDTTAPIIGGVPLHDVTQEANASTGYVWPGVPMAELWLAVQASDDVDVLVDAVCVPSSTDSFALTTTEVSCVATDVAGNESAAETFDVIIVDTTPPTIDASMLPMPAAQEANGTGGYSPTTPLWSEPVVGAGTDIVDGTTDVICTPGPQSLFPLGTTQVSCSSTDSEGNETIISPAFEVTVGDSTPPTVELTLVGGDTFEATSAAGASVSYTAVATDIFSTSLSVSCSVDGAAVSSPHVFPLGESTLSCISIDDEGNQGSAMTLVTVVDTTPPVITLLGANPQEVASFTPYVELGATAQDIVDGNLSGNIVIDATNVDTDAIDSYTVTYNVVDSAGNAATEVIRSVDVVFGYEIHFSVPKGNIRAGSTLPMDWYYTLPGSNTAVDSSTFAPRASWLGKYSVQKCGGDNEGDGDGMDSGASGYRWSGSSRVWQYSWQTPPAAGSYRFIVTPPGGVATGICITLR